MFLKFSGSDALEILMLCAGAYFENSMAQIFGKSFCCLQDHIVEIKWLRYSGNLSVGCRSVLRKFNGADTREILPLAVGKYFGDSVAQIVGKSFCFMQEHAWKVQWLRYSGNPSLLCRNSFRKFNGSDTREILLSHAGIYCENSMAQILWKSFCCMQEYILKF